MANIIIQALIFALAVAGCFAEETTKSTHTTEALKSVGGKLEVPADDAHVNELLKENIARLVSGESKLEVVAVKKITKQTVAGIKYEILGTFKMGEKTVECTVTCWYRAWLEDLNERFKLKADCAGEAIAVKGDAEW